MSLLLTAMLAGCSSGHKRQSAATDVRLRWATTNAGTLNGKAPAVSAVAACGSDTETYLAELLHTPVASAKVLHEWGDVVAGGKQVAVSGTVTFAHLGPTDLPMSHPYGDDLSMDVRLDEPFTPFNRVLGPAKFLPNEMHVEISSGLIPHRPSAPSNAATQTWRQASDADLTGFLDRFDHPPLGVRTLVMGRWIVDCGHASYETELHPMSFLAWTDQPASGATTARAYYNPYRDTEMYTPDASTQAKPFIPYLADTVAAVVTGRSDHLQSKELVEPTTVSPPPWQVCAPGATRANYDIVTRPGVTVNVSKPASGCVTVTVTLTKDYHALAPALRQCKLPWTYLSEVTNAALSTPVDVKALIQKQVPSFLRFRIDPDPDTTCADPLSGPDVTGTPTGQQTRVQENQPFPFYGVIRVGS